MFAKPIDEKTPLVSEKGKQKDLPISITTKVLNPANSVEAIIKIIMDNLPKDEEGIKLANKFRLLNRQSKEIVNSYEVKYSVKEDGKEVERSGKILDVARVLNQYYSKQREVSRIKNSYMNKIMNIKECNVGSCITTTGLLAGVISGTWVADKTTALLSISSGNIPGCLVFSGSTFLGGAICAGLTFLGVKKCANLNQKRQAEASILEEGNCNPLSLTMRK